MHRLVLLIAFTLGAFGIAFAQSPGAEDHTVHHPPAASQPGQSNVQSGQAAQHNSQAGQPSAGATAGPPTSGMMQGMMQMMQGMQGMMRMMHQQTQTEQRQTARTQIMHDCPMMARGHGPTADVTTMQGMMQMMQAMMQMMQSHMQSGQGHR
jgi:hypothetical protein